MRDRVRLLGWVLLRLPSRLPSRLSSRLLDRFSWSLPCCLWNRLRSTLARLAALLMLRCLAAPLAVDRSAVARCRGSPSSPSGRLARATAATAPAAAPPTAAATLAAFATFTTFTARAVLAPALLPLARAAALLALARGNRGLLLGLFHPGVACQIGGAWPIDALHVRDARRAAFQPRFQGSG